MADTIVQSLASAQVANHIGVVTISNPPVNTLSNNVCAALLTALDECEQGDARAVILRTDPKSKIWSAGHDIHEIPVDGHDAVTWTTGFVQVLRRIRAFPAPVIAMLHSSVWGAACDLAVTCDLATGTSRTTFAITPVKIGISYNSCGVSHFLGSLPTHIVKEMFFTGEPLSAQDAFRLGLLNRLVEPEQLEKATMDLAATIASRAPLAIAAAKAELQCLTQGVPLHVDEFEAIQAKRRAAFISEDLKEGVRSFFEKRAPVFEGK